MHQVVPASSRRDFLKRSAVGLALLSMPAHNLNAQEIDNVSNKKTKHKNVEEGSKLESQTDSLRKNEQLHQLDHALRLTNPIVSHFFLDWFRRVLTANMEVAKNMQAFEDGTTTMEDTTDLCNLKLSRAAATPFTFIIGSTVGLVFDRLARRVLPITEKLNPDERQSQSILTMSAFHGRTLAYTYFQVRMIQAYKSLYESLLESNPNYNNNPLNISYSDFFRAHLKYFPILLKGLTSGIKEMYLGAKKSMRDAAGSPRTLVDASLVGTSVIAAYKYNEATGKAIGAPLQLAMSGRKQCSEMPDSQKKYDDMLGNVVAQGSLSPLGGLINWGTQAIVGKVLSVFSLKISKNKLAESNGLYTIGQLASLYVLSKFRATVVTSIEQPARKVISDVREGATSNNGSLFSRFTKALVKYAEPKDSNYELFS